MVEVPSQTDLDAIRTEVAALKQKVETGTTPDATIVKRLDDIEEGIEQWQQNADARQNHDQELQRQVQALTEQTVQLRTELEAVKSPPTASPQPIPTPSLEPSLNPSPSAELPKPEPSLPEPPEPKPDKNDVGDPPAPAAKRHRLI